MDRFQLLKKTVWAGALSFHLNKSQKQVFRTAGPTTKASLEPLTHRRNVASLSFISITFGTCLSELAELAPLPYSRGRSTSYSNSLHGFYVAIPTCYKDVCINSFFSCAGRLWNVLPVECFLLNCNLNCFKSRVNRHLATLGSF